MHTDNKVNDPSGQGHPPCVLTTRSVTPQLEVAVCVKNKVVVPFCKHRQGQGIFHLKISMHTGVKVSDPSWSACILVLRSVTPQGQHAYWYQGQ
eukprot:TRINITY_DN116916_c0_g1_i1.p1 TRINITY_DN116916_c0_g1~~TRINITY_DN116916_c0_g1_i1.p1  ORF type:complete len:101 (-),score=12.81 TRINITY_DN116916_c0_g1_i1:12-293(-)